MRKDSILTLSATIAALQAFESWEETESIPTTQVKRWLQDVRQILEAVLGLEALASLEEEGFLGEQRVEE